MKKLVQILILQAFILAAFTSANAQQVTDVNLKNMILANCPTCLDNNGYLLPDAQAITNLSLNFGTDATVQTTKGLEGFTNVSNITFFNSFNSSSLNHKVDSLPQNLFVLHLLSANYKKIDKLPSNLKTLWIVSYSDSTLPQFPNSLKTILLHIKNVTVLPTLPESLDQLSLINADNLSFLPTLPRKCSLLDLEAQHNTKLSVLPVLPSTLTYINVKNFIKLRYIPNLPNSIKSIYLTGDSLFEQLPTPFPTQLDVLFIEGTKIRCLPILPNSITQLHTSDINCLTNIPTFLIDINMQIGNLTVRNKLNIAICNRTNSNCQYPASISGKIYHDSNNNSIQDNNEPYTKQLPIKSTDGNLTTLTDTLGKYFLIGDSLKTYTFSPIFSNNYFKVVPLSRTITTTAAIAQRFDSLDFAIQSLGTFPDIALSLTSGNARPGFNSISTLTYKNVGTTTLNGTITLTLDAKQTFVSADVIPTQNGNVLTWNYTNLQPFEVKNINITLKTLVTAPLSSRVFSTAQSTITGATDANNANNSEETGVTVRGAYDPNDKQVSPSVVGSNGGIATRPLTYTIRFQNTGNAEAIRVEVVDTLTKKLDITTLEMLGASHPYELKIVSDSGKVKDFTVVKWVFDDINLPDSTSNEKGSHGFIKFRIKNDTRKMGATMDSIFNKAAIYFDFNKPIITNSTKTLFVLTVSATEMKDLGLSVFPNPTTGILTINATKKTAQELTIDVMNMNGQVLMHQILRGQNPQINVQELAAGLYFLKVKTSEGIGVMKIIKH